VAARNLGSIYGNLGKSIERLSSGLRINRAADDAAGLAVREMMRADVAATLQGIRNAADAVSLIQTADGALGVIDAKLIRMKELAEQAATGTYTTAQRLIINSEFQAMANEIDRIANATNFNGIKLLDGQLSANGGIRIHFGPNNNAAEDYYYINTADVRARSSTGLNLGGASTNDIWGMGAGDGSLNGCCGGAFADRDEVALTTSGTAFAYAYNWDANPSLFDENGSALINFDNAGRYLAGLYGYNQEGGTIGDVIDLVNAGTQSRAMITLSAIGLEADDDEFSVICLSSVEAYYIGSASGASAYVGADSRAVFYALTTATAAGIAAAINSSSLNYWALASGDSLYVFRNEGGDFNDTELGYYSTAAVDADKVLFTNLATDQESDVGTKLSFGGERWARMSGVTVGTGSELNITLEGAGFGEGYDLRIVNLNDANFATNIPEATRPYSVIDKLGTSMHQVQDAVDGRGDIRTQEAAQTALEDINAAIIHKDNIRAALGATQNRLEATIENLTVQAENLQAAESRISDVDVALEMTEFTKQNVLAQAAAAMLAQANSMSTLALTLLA
jgi:flagellin